MRVRRAIAVPGDDPIVDLNTTPLIDVMLVLLIMFILTIPTATHQVPLDLPQGISESTGDPVVHRLQLDRAGRVTLDGANISYGTLPSRLGAIAREPHSELHLSADPETPYERFDEVLATVHRAGVTRMGMDNHRFAEALR